MKREIDADLAFLEKTSKGAPAGPGEEEIKKILRAQRKVRKTLRREGRL